MELLKIQLVLNSIKHLEEKSYYNCNYFEIEPYGDWCYFFGNNVIEAVCHKEDNYYTFTLGHFDNGEFIGVLQWNSEYGKGLFDYIKEE